METGNQNCKEKCSDCSVCRSDQIPFLAGLPLETEEKIMSSALRRTFQKDERIFQEGDPVDAIYVIHQGRVKLSYWDIEGREQIVGIFLTGDTIWEGVFLENAVYPYEAVCEELSDICRISREALEESLQDPTLALKVIGMLSQKLHDSNERVQLLTVVSPRARVAGFLMMRSRHAGRDTVEFKLDTIAASIHLRPETVSRKLREFMKEGLIQKIGQSKIQILDPEELQRVFRED